MQSFQSIGVTKVWRPTNPVSQVVAIGRFPINRRHQGLATRLEFLRHYGKGCSFQSIGVTKDWRPPTAMFPCPNPNCFQSIDVTKDWRLFASLFAVRDDSLFPINRRHQRLATPAPSDSCPQPSAGFQSIGVTKDWRLETVVVQPDQYSGVSNQ